jgi:RTX calcium-binding nonapeptide repeat (4 copies)
MAKVELVRLSGNSYAWAKRLTIKRTSGSDDLEGRGGNDTLRVQATGDELWGGPARYFVYGGPGGASVLADETLFASVPTSQAGNDVIYGGPGREEVDSQTGADDHGRLGYQPLISRLPSSTRTS